MSSDYDYLFKILLVGDSGTGKSSILLRYSDDIFSDSYISTIGVDFRIRKINLNSKVIKFQIWDTAGQERFRTIVSLYSKGAHLIAVVYSCDTPETFENVGHWLEEVDKFSSFGAKVVLVANKIDSNPRKVSTEAGKALAQQHGISYFEVSAKTTTGISSLFDHIGISLMNKDLKPEEIVKTRDSESLNVTEEEKKAEVSNIKQESQNITKTEETPPKEVNFKLLLIGASQSGKSCLLLRYADDIYTESYISTIGVDFKIKNITVGKQTVKLQIWDTAGQERFRTITSSYYRGAHFIIIVFNPSDQDSIDQISNFALEVQRFASDNVKTALVANVFNENRLISKENAKDLAESINAQYYELSAKTAENVNSTFESIVKSLLHPFQESKTEEIQTEEVKIEKNPPSIITLALLGDEDVGKSSFLLKFTDDFYSESISKTVGVDFKKTFQGNNNEIRVWDLSGSEKYQSLHKNYLENADGIVLVYDITNQDSFDHLHKYYEMIKRDCNEKCKVLLVGNKCDLHESRKVLNQRGEAMAEHYQSEFLETSAKENVNIKKAFEVISEKIINDR